MKRSRQGRRSMKNPDSIAAVLSVIPGLGHIYKGHYFQGICILVGDAVIAMGIGTVISLAYVAACIFQGFQISVGQAMADLFNSPTIVILFVSPVLLYWAWTTWDAFSEPDLRHHRSA